MTLQAFTLQEAARYDSPTKPVSPGLRYASPSPAKGQMSRMGRNGSQASPFTPVPTQHSLPFSLLITTTYFSCLTRGSAHRSSTQAS